MGCWRIEGRLYQTAWPEYDESVVNADLEREMDLAYKIVKLGRSARNGANIKNRQPLGEMLVSIASLPEYYGDIIKEELNIKNIVFGADLSEHVNFEIKPNLPVLGKAYGKLIPAIRKALGEMDQMKLAQDINSGKTVTIDANGTSIDLTKESLLVTMKGLEGFAFAGEGEVGVVLDTHITEELKEEGYLREILSKVQNMRKESGFEVLDRINLYVAGNEMLEEVIKKYSGDFALEYDENKSNGSLYYDYWKVLPNNVDVYRNTTPNRQKYCNSWTELIYDFTQFRNQYILEEYKSNMCVSGEIFEDGNYANTIRNFINTKCGVAIIRNNSIISDFKPWRITGPKRLVLNDYDGPLKEQNRTGIKQFGSRWCENGQNLVEFCGTSDKLIELCYGFVLN